MAQIDEMRKHTLGKEAVRQKAEELAQDIADKIKVKYKWDGDNLRFNRTGADGHISVSDDEVRIQIKLGLMFRPLKGILETKIRTYMDEKLS